jgi:hypothetical protein
LGGSIDHQLRLDLTSGQVTQAGAEMFAQDLRTHPRALVTGDSWQTGTPTDSVDFRVDGSQLIPGTDESDHPTQVFDTATGKPVRLRLPTGYRPDENNSEELAGDRTFTLFEWLDDDTVALRHYDDNGGDIITCQLSDGRCVLVVENQEHFLAPLTPGTRGWNIPG